MRIKSKLVAGGLLAIAFVAGPALAMPITKTLTIDVFVVCDDAGLNCASTGPAGNAYFAAETNKIWAQAGISVGFNFVQNINSTAFSHLDDTNPNDSFPYLASLYGTNGPSSTTVDMFLVHTLTVPGGAAYGEGWLDFGGLVIAMDLVMGFNQPYGRVDTIAHELGHNLGLLPDSLGGVDGHSTVATELMASGGIRYVPTTLADISPDGLGYDNLPTGQINYARASSLLRDVPEPGIAALLALGLLGLPAARRRTAVS